MFGYRREDFERQSVERMKLARDQSPPLPRSMPGSADALPVRSEPDAGALTTERKRGADYC